MTTNAKIKKWGNSLAIRIPNAIANATGITDETSVKIISNGRFVTITPVKKRQAMTVEDLFKGVTPENVHPEVDWGPDVGAERWYDDEE